MSGSHIRAAAIVFIASFCTLVIELVAGRVLAPYVGVSLYTWTSIIGVVLAGISLGAYAGGWLADRRPLPSTLGWLLLASGLAAVLIAPATAFLAADEGLLTTIGLATTLLQRVVVLSFLLFFVPSFLLGMISPVAVKLSVGDLARAGRVVGGLYAFSTLGSIAGTFATGFWLIARFGTRTTLVGVGVVLIATALAAGGLMRRTGGAAAAAALLAGACAYAGLSAPAIEPPHQRPMAVEDGTRVVHFEESQYYTIQVKQTVRQDTGAPLYALHLDHLIHSYADLDDPTYFEYGYLRMFDEVARAAIQRRDRARLLFIGGGGYTLPKHLAATSNAAIDVVEIDPAVTRVARRYFGVSRSAAIRSINEDARWFAMNTDGSRRYDAVFIDAFNDLSVPYHLTTREFAQHVNSLLAPDGVVAVNVIDDYEDGRFLASYVRTLQSVFGTNHVSVALEEPDDVRSDRSTFVVTAGISVPSFADYTVLAPAELRRYLARRNAIVLTDDYAPVDNMLAPLFTARFVDEQ